MYISERKAYRECVEIVDRLIKLNEDYTSLRVLAVRDSSNFDEEVIRFSGTLGNAKRKIRDFIAKYEVSPIWELNFEESTLKLGFKGLHSHEVKTVKPIAMHPTLLKELIKGIPRASSITKIVDHRICAQSKEQESNLLSPKEASKMLGVSYKTLWRWAKEGKIHAVRLPTRHHRYPKEEIERILHNKPARKE